MYYYLNSLIRLILFKLIMFILAACKFTLVN